MNGTKSRGPRSERGKAIASKNATKHGLLAERPPLVMGENLETFQGIVQGLIDEYQPSGPVEFFLVQQVAMAMLRLHRLWGVEAAIANHSMFQKEMSIKYPDQIILDLSILNQTLPRSSAEKAEMQRMEQQINSVAITSLAVPDIGRLEKLTRYERHLTKQLQDALDRLQSIQQQRQNETSIGSFRQNGGC